jgi:tellurite resistance protein TerC
MIAVWVGFVIFVIIMLALDLGVFHRKAHVVSLREAAGWSCFWISLGLSFSVFVYFAYQNHWFGLGHAVDPVDGILNGGHTAAVKFLTGYVVEESLSADNMFVIAMIFQYFAVPRMYQHRVLFWGIMGALILRGLMIGLGVALISRFHWILYVFGAFLIFTAIRMLMMKTEHVDLSRNKIVRLARRLFPITSCYHGEYFVVRAGSEASKKAAMPGGDAVPDAALSAAKAGTIFLTPLMLTLLVVETTDVVFAVDSIPAIFAITADPFLVFTSNVFAILGLRSLYGALAGMIDKFRYLKVALSVILLIIGVKMLTVEWLKEILGKNFNFYLLGLVISILAIGIVTSLVADARENAGKDSPEGNG